MSQPSQSLEEIFLEALELPSDVERMAFLNKSCGGDGELRARVDRLLAAVPKVDSYLESPAYMPTDGFHPDSLPTPSDMTGQTLGPYRLVRELGAGGMGVVYLAEQEHPVRRQVALKVIRGDLGSPQAAARFEQERAVLELMDHPNIARVLDAGSTDDGHPYFAMEMVQGISITRYCDEQQLSIKERIELLVPVCQAIQHAHQKGIIHRDLKPSNVIVGLYDRRPIPKVIDFGVAKATGQRLIDRTMVTEAGQIVGTMEYMAPEQAEMSNFDIDTRADIYSLGVLLYELLTGSPPFSVAELRSAGLGEMLRIIKEVEPTKPSTKIIQAEDLPSVAAKRRIEPSRLSAVIRGELDWIVLKCLEKDRARRYDSAMGLANDLERYLADEPVLACPPSARYRLGKVIRRNKQWVASGAVILFLLVGGIIAQSFALVAVSRAQAAEAKRRTQTRAALDAMSSSVIEGWLTKQPVLQPEHTDFLRQAVRFYEEFAADTAEDEESRRGTAAALYRVGRIREQLGEHTEAKKVLQRCCDHYQALLRDFPSNRSDHSAHAEALLQLQSCRLNLGEYADSEGGVRQAVKTYRELVASAPDDREALVNLADSLSTLGGLMRQLGRMAEGESACNESISILEGVVQQVPDNDRYQIDLGGSLTNLANVLSDMGGREEDAINAGRRTVEINESLLAKSPRSLEFRVEFSLVSGNLCDYLIALDRYAEAEVAARKSIEILVQLVLEFPAVPQYRRSLAIARNNLGIALKESGQLPAAEEEYRQALAIYQELSASQPENSEHKNAVGGSFVNVARVLLMRNDPQGARELLERATPFHQAAITASPNHPRFRYFYRINRWRMAEALVALKEHTAAADMSAQFLQMAAEQPRDAMTATGLLASCVKLATEDPSLPPAEQQACADKYAQSALETLRQAIREGFTSVEFLKSDSQLEPLRNREEFQAIVRKLEST